MQRASWQTITWVLVAAILVYVLLGPNLMSWGLAIVGVLGAVIKAAEERWVTWRLARRRQVSPRAVARNGQGVSAAKGKG